jgi:hypothetical protein
VPVKVSVNAALQEFATETATLELVLLPTIFEFPAPTPLTRDQLQPVTLAGALKVTVVFGQTLVEPEMEKVGEFVTVTVTVALLVQPFTSVPTTVYDVVEDGLAVTLDPVVALKPLAGDHE